MPMTPTALPFVMRTYPPTHASSPQWWRGIGSIERCDAEIARRTIEAGAQRLGHGNAVRGAILRLVMALLARQPDALDAGQPFGGPHRPDRDVDLALERRRRCEGLDRHRNDGVPGIGRAARLLDEIDDLPSKRGSIEGS